MRRWVRLPLVLVAALQLAGCRLSVPRRFLPPERLSLTASAGKLVVTWTAVPDAALYRVYVASAPGVGPTTVGSLPDGQILVAHQGPLIVPASAQKTWYVAVASIDSSGIESEISAELSGKPLAPGAFSMGAAAWTVSGGGGFGNAVAVGDFNADGLPDLAVGSPFLNNGAGQVDVFEGAAGGFFHAAASATFSSGYAVANDKFGENLAVGDLDGDGIDDLVVGKEAVPSTLTVFFGDPTLGLNGQRSVGSSAGNAIGRNLAVGHVNGGAQADLLAGGFDPISALGSVQYVPGNGYDLFGAPPAATVDDANQVGAGIALADVNGDGFDDVIFGAPAKNDGQISVLFGPTPVNAPLIVAGPVTESRFGARLHRAGDVDGDGREDVLVVSSDGVQGTLHLVVTTAGLLGVSSWNFPFATNSTDPTGSNYLAAAGDIDGDGFADVVVGDSDFSTPAAAAGRVLLFTGEPGGLSSTPALEADGGVASGYFGSSLAVADVNGDGRPDLIVGSEGEPAVRAFAGTRQQGPRVEAGNATLDPGGTTISLEGAGFVDVNGKSEAHTCSATLAGTTKAIACDQLANLKIAANPGYLVLTVTADDQSTGMSATRVRLP